MLALADRSDNKRRRLAAAEAVRFTDAYSQLGAIRYPFDVSYLDDGFQNEWNAAICDRYAFFMRVSMRLGVINVYDLDRGAVRFVN